MKVNTWKLGVSGLLFFAATVSGYQEPAQQRSGQAGPVLLRHKVQPGVTRRYRVETTVDFEFKKYTCKDRQLKEQAATIIPPPKEQKLLWIIEEEKCESIGPDGAGRFWYRIESFGVRDSVAGKVVTTFTAKNLLDLKTLVGEPRAMIAGSLMEAPISYKMDSSGKISDLRLPKPTAAELLEAYSAAMQARYDAVLPRDAVSVGSTWESNFSKGAELGNIGLVFVGPIKSKAKLIELLEIDNRLCAVIDVAYDMGVPAKPRVFSTQLRFRVVKATGKSRFVFAVEDGCPVSEDSVITTELEKSIGDGPTPLLLPYTRTERVRSKLLSYRKAE